MSILTQQAPPKACDGFAGGIAAIAPGKLYALQNPFALDGRVSSYPASARGYAVANSYLLTQRDAAMLITLLTHLHVNFVLAKIWLEYL